MSSIGHPLVGDLLYGGGGTKFEAGSKALLQGQCLHARELRLTHPKSGEEMHFECPLPDNFTALLEKLRAQSL
jgi:23S rRNA pseudouridine1911/1915/1917 synthase